MFYFRYLLCFLCLSFTCSVYAEHKVGASLTLVSDRLLRGFSLSNEEPSLYGGVHYGNTNFGLYADAVVFTNIQINGEDELQLDAVLGYKFDLDKVKLDVGFVQHAFSEYSESDSGEAYAGVIFPNFSFHYYDNVDVEEVYLDANGHYQFAEKYNLLLHLGQLNSDNDSVDFVDYSVQVNRDIEWFTTFNIGLTYSYNDNDEALKDLAGSRVVLGVSKHW
ncbi:TorF family putative porin [Teredinibacter sp. KSP-S5-2]|uniref:TorF family putative porin n=1 Tax=Teredinibacter sp. KSP-S5-2 TaxID=3034506 RepID=UPI002934B358|nr:TorF family putative porin [Teredinibacter sp. KSP-S5-2]WNO08785.1 TorF family putative porin [Teredinibacter sp. KSP-S5-2]